MSRQIVVIAHNLRSCHNVGSLLRTAEGLGITSVYLTGYTPYPLKSNDSRLPHIANKLDRQISKTALGAEKLQDWHQSDHIEPVIKDFRSNGYTIGALEQTKQAIKLPDYRPTDKLVIILGEEVTGVSQEILDLTDLQLIIPMFGKKESFNVVQAGAMALYHCKFT